MNKNLKQILIGTAMVSLVLLGSLTMDKLSQPRINAQGEGGAAPVLKLTWDFSTNNTTDTAAFTTTTLATFITTYDAPDYTYTFNSTNNTYQGGGTTPVGLPYDNWKFSSSSVSGTASISGLPAYGFVRVWAMQWSPLATTPDTVTMQINGGTPQSIVGNTTYNLYEFDVSENTTDFIIAAGGPNNADRFMIQKIEFWGC